MGRSTTGYQQPHEWKPELPSERYRPVVDEDITVIEALNDVEQVTKLERIVRIEAGTMPPLRPDADRAILRSLASERNRSLEVVTLHLPKAQRDGERALFRPKERVV